MSEHVRRGVEIPEDPVSAGRETTRQLLTEPTPGSVFHMRRFVMQPGGGLPPHTNQVEHQQFVLRGTAVIGLGEAVVRVGPGDVVHIPAGLPHWYRSEGPEPFEVLCAVPNAPDEIRMIATEDPGC